MQQNDVGLKFDGQKPKMDLLFDGTPNALLEVGKVLTFGAKKYAAHNWKQVEGGTTRYKAALIRHLLAQSAGEKVDQDSGLPHLAHIACNALFLLELELNDNERKETKEDNTEIAGAAVGVPQRVRDQIAADHRRIIEAQRVREAQDKVHDPFKHSHLHSRFFLTK